MKKMNFDRVGMLEHIKSKLGDNLIVAEVGCYQGDFSKEILKNLTPKEFHMVDSWGRHLPQYKDYRFLEKNDGWEKLYDEIKRNFNLKNVCIHRKQSMECVNEFPDKYFDFVYIDADHSYQSVKNDILAWSRKVKDGGILSGHDYIMNSVKQALEEVRGEDYFLTKERMKSWFFEI